ncbi:MAG: PhzF family phenazine biosynthesis protein [Myxococcales bacterium]|nr:MAG: PhzF family phenazine biosynthesis protein [Myxococcales bacterium]
MSRRFHIVDVFAEAPLEGNQLAVVRDAGDLGTAAMQGLAREFGFSETTFVVSDPRAFEAGVRVRIFTPAEELPFAGHPTLGSAWVIREHLAGQRVDAVALELGVGRVPVRFEAEAGGPEVAWLAAPPIELGARVPAARIAPVLGLGPEDLDPALPVQHVLAGIGFLFVPLRSLDAVRRGRLDLHAFEPLAREGLPAQIYLFCREALEETNDLHARMLFAAPDVREDPATGSATACLGAYLLAHRAFGTGPLSLRIEQGIEMKRPSLLRLRASDAAGEPQIEVGGRVIETARGELL